MLRRWFSSKRAAESTPEAVEPELVQLCAPRCVGAACGGGSLGLHQTASWRVPDLPLVATRPCRVYSCATCRCHTSNADAVVSKARARARTRTRADTARW